MSPHRCLFLILIALFLSSRVLFLFTNIACITFEEGITAILSKHIAENKQTTSIFEYSPASPFAGGIVFSAYLTVPLLLLFGYSPYVLKIVPILYSLFILIVMFLFLEKYFGLKVALLSSIFFIFSPLQVTYWNLFYNSNHFEGALFTMLLMVIFFNLFFNGEPLRSKLRSIDGVAPM